MYGAYNDDNDPTGKKRKDHAMRYYEELRHRDEDAEVKNVSRNTGIGESVVRQAYRHVFINEHDLADGHTRFRPDYDMSQSWQRLSTGVGIRSYDPTLIFHEAIESELMAAGLEYTDAHDKTCEMGYDWWQELLDWETTHTQRQGNVDLRA